MLGGVPAGRDDQIGVAKSSTSQPTKSLPHFQPVGEHDRTEFPGMQSHRRDDGGQVRMQCDHKQWPAPRRTQSCEAELQLVVRASGKMKFLKAEAYGVQPLWVV